MGHGHAGRNRDAALTAIGSTSVSSGSELSATIAKHGAGDRVKIPSADADDDSRTATVILTAGPAD